MEEKYGRPEAELLSELVGAGQLFRVNVAYFMETASNPLHKGFPVGKGHRIRRSAEAAWTPCGPREGPRVS